MLITLENLSKTFGEEPLIKGLFLTFAEHQTTVLIGPSGCGKSTILRLILGLLSPTTGSIFFNYQKLTPLNVDQWRQQIGYVTQEGGLFPHLTARQNIVLMARFFYYEEGWIQQRLKELSELVRLPLRYLDQYPTELSGGQRQRVSLMRALFLDPRCLLLDEPLGALDPIARHKLQVELKQIFLDLHKTLVLVTHDMQEAAYLGDEIVLMRRGRISQKGSFQELVDHPAEHFVTEFIQHQQLYTSEKEMLMFKMAE
jgi:osmoprotectant transport system ATP-binding protein